MATLPGFLDRYPAIRVVMSMTDRQLDIVDTGIDVAIRAGRQRDSSLRARKIGDSRRLVCASPDYLARAGRPRKPEDLEAHNCVTWRDHPGHNVWTFRGRAGQTRVRATGSFFAQSADALVAAAVAGMGVVLLPDWNMGIELRARRLRPVLTRYEAVPATTPVYAMYASQPHVPSKVRAFVDYLTAAC